MSNGARYGGLGTVDAGHNRHEPRTAFDPIWTRRLPSHHFRQNYESLGDLLSIRTNKFQAGGPEDVGDRCELAPQALSVVVITVITLALQSTHALFQSRGGPSHVTSNRA